MIRLEKVTKYFDVKGNRKYLMKDVSLTIPDHRNVGILGRNGAGKSTLLKMLGGIDFPNQGKIVADVDFSWPLGLSGGFQGSLTGKENAQFISRVYSRSDEQLKETLNFVLDFSELDGYFDMPVKTYSSGMKSRLAFSMSLAFDFDYYLIDETLAVGDAIFKKKCKTALDDLKKKRNILMVSHGMPMLRQMCDCGIVLEDGNLSYFEKIEDAIACYQAL
jgi:capsular polysaccharide transport system ATP-binding protein